MRCLHANEKIISCSFGEIKFYAGYEGCLSANDLGNILLLRNIDCKSDFNLGNIPLFPLNLTHPNLSTKKNLTAF